MAIGMMVNGKMIYFMEKASTNGVMEKNMRVSMKEAKSMVLAYLPMWMGQDTMASSAKVRKLAKRSPLSDNLNFNLIIRQLFSQIAFDKILTL